jgi:hypothetical protein
MGLIEFLIVVVVAVVLGWLAVYVIGQLAPTHPPIIDRLIWVAVILIVVVTLLRALGILQHDPQIPRL